MRLESDLVGPNLRLASLDESAASGAYLHWMRDPEVLRYLEARHGSHDVESLRCFIRDANGSSDNLLLGIFLKADGRHIGNIKLGPIDRPNRRGEVGFMVGERASWGKGYASEAVELVCRHAFSILGLHKITAGYIASNKGSARIFTKLGFFEEGRLKQHFLVEGRWEDGMRVARIADGGT